MDPRCFAEERTGNSGHRKMRFPVGFLQRQSRVPKPWGAVRKRAHAVVSDCIVYLIVLVGLACGGIQCWLTFKFVRVSLDLDFRD